MLDARSRRSVQDDERVLYQKGIIQVGNSPELSNAYQNEKNDLDPTVLANHAELL
jgi:hypothetical protein